MVDGLGFSGQLLEAIPGPIAVWTFHFINITQPPPLFKGIVTETHDKNRLVSTSSCQTVIMIIHQNKPWHNFVMIRKYVCIHVDLIVQAPVLNTETTTLHAGGRITAVSNCSDQSATCIKDSQ